MAGTKIVRTSRPKHDYAKCIVCGSSAYDDIFREKLINDNIAKHNKIIDLEAQSLLSFIGNKYVKPIREKWVSFLG